jgi:hypothetical protein
MIPGTRPVFRSLPAASYGAAMESKLTFPPIPIPDMRGGFADFLDRIHEIGNESNNEPSAGSQALMEFADSGLHEQLKNAWSIGSLLLQHGFDHISAFIKLIDEPIDPIASATNTRSMLESCAISAWLLDPAIDTQTRVGRQYAYRLSGQTELLKFMNSAKAAASEIAARKSHIEDLKAEAFSCNCARRSPGGASIEISTAMPSATEMIRTQLEEEFFYRLLSGVAHGHFWALRFVGFSIAGETTHMGAPATALVKTPKPQTLTLLGYISAVAIIRSTWNLCVYFGWDKLKVEEQIETLADMITIQDEFRFWRSA